MRIEAISLRHVRRFGAEGVRVEGLTPGLNVLAAPNESGKTTLADAVRACLTVPHTHRKPVESLVPASGGNPWIALDVVTADGAFRIEKRFMQDRLARITDRRGEVVAQAADADAWLREAIGADKSGDGPMGLVWIRQDASTELPDPGGTRGDAVRNLIGRQVSGVVGGERTQRVIGAARRRLSDYLTDKSGRVARRGPLGEAEARVAELEAEAERLRAVTERARRTAADLAEVDGALAKAEDSSESARRREAVSAAETALADAVRQDAALDGLRSEAARAAEHAANAEAAAAALARDQAAAAEAEAALCRAREAAESAEARRTVLVARASAAEDAANHAEAALRRARAALAAARASGEARMARQALERVTARYDEAAAARDALAALPPEGPTIDLEVLQALSDEATLARARAEAARATIRVEAAGDLRIEGQTVTEGETRPVTRPLTLELGDARIVVAPPSIGEIAPEAAADRSEQALADALGAVGAASVAEARRAAQDAERRRQSAATHEATLARVAPDGLGSLEAERHELARTAEAAAPDEDTDPASAEAAREEAEALASEARGTLRQAERDAGTAREAAVAARSALASADERAREAEARAGARDKRAAARAAATEARDRAVDTAEAAARRLAAAQSALPDLGAARDRVAALREAQENRGRKATALRERRAELSGALRHAYEGDAAEALSRTEDALAVAREDAAREALELDALQLLESTLGAVQAERLDRYLGPVTAELGPLIDAVFPGAALSLDGELSLGGLRRGAREEGLERLSGGTREQIAILAKLAFARLLAKGGQAVPLVMDDALVFADDERLSRMFRAVRLAAEDVQILALTCRADAYEPLGGNAIGLRPL